MKYFSSLMIYIIVLIVSSCVGASEIYVSNSFSDTTCNDDQKECHTIQSALYLANSSDIVLVHPGFYEGVDNCNLCQSKNCSQNITLSGFGGDASSVVLNYADVDSSTARAVYMTLNQLVYLKDLTIQNFNGTIAIENSNTNQLIQIGGGAAVFVTQSSVFLENVFFRHNTGIIGGAVNLLHSNITISNCTFDANQAEISGGALSAYLSNVQISGSRFLNNNVTSFEIVETASIGGALYILGGHLNKFAVRNSFFVNNKAERGGGAIYMESNSKTSADEGAFYSHNVIYRGNYANGIGTCISTASCNTRGGALYLSVPSVYLRNDIFEDNFVTTISATTEAQGGAVYSTNLYNAIQQARGTQINGCAFSGNSAKGAGGALYVLNQRLQLVNSSFSFNMVDTVSPLFTDAPSQGGAVWYSANSLSSQITNCLFESNEAFSGWGGAIFGTASVGLLTLDQCTFFNNAVYSSYTNPGQGGAIMIASEFNLELKHSRFQNNSALPHLNLVPLTYSGSGGALFVQSSNITVDHCDFELNFALTGQFDAGSAGGAIVLENSYPAKVHHSNFLNNGAAGYYGYSSFASPGTGGAIYIKFSSADVDKCQFHNNWVSAGGSEKSIGGAVAIYFSYSSVADDSSSAGVRIERSVFNNNTAYGQLCLLNGQSGEGGAIGIVGASTPSVRFNNLNFTYNAALASPHSILSSMGGAMSITLSSNVTATACVFHNNVAIAGAGNDIASVSGQNNQQNFIYFQNSTFHAASSETENYMLSYLIPFEFKICNYLKHVVEDATHEGEQKRRLGGRRRLVESVLGGTVSNEMDSTAVEFSSSIFATGYSSSSSGQKVQNNVHNLQTHYAKDLQYPQLKKGDKKQDSLDEAKQAVKDVLSHLKVVDEFLLTSSSTHSEQKKITDATQPISVEETEQANKHTLGSTFKDNLLKELTHLKRSVRRLGSEVESRDRKQFEMEQRRVRTASQYKGSTQYTTGRHNRLLGSDSARVRQLSEQNPASHERLFRNSLYADKVDYSSDSQSRLLSASSSSGSGSEAYIFSNSSGIDSLIDFHPSIVVTSGEALFGNPTFVGSYHMFFGNYYEFLTSTVTNQNLDDGSPTTLSQLPSTSIIYGDIIQDHLIVTVLKATLTLYSQKHLQNNFELSQVNIFNGTLFISNNITINDDSFVSDSTISGIRSSTNDKFDYIIARYSNYNVTLANPTIKFKKILYTGYNIGDLIAQSEGTKLTSIVIAINNTQQSVFALDSCTLLVLDRLILDSPIQNLQDIQQATHDTSLSDPSDYYANIKFVLKNSALLNISSSGSMIILSDTFVEASNSSSNAIYNAGEIALLGDTKSVVNTYSKSTDSNGKVIKDATYGSLTSTLTVYGSYVQTDSGTLSLILNSTFSTTPIVSLYSNKSFGGSVNISFYIDAANKQYPNLVLYSDSQAASSWSIISYTIIEDGSVVDELDSSIGRLTVEAPQGLEFTGFTKNVGLTGTNEEDVMEQADLDTRRRPNNAHMNTASTYKGQALSQPARGLSQKFYTSNTPHFVQSLVVSKIGCNHIQTYYEDVALSPPNSLYPCYICLMNSSCNLCGDGTCSVAGTCSSAKKGTKYSSSCCSTSCNPPYGSCEGSSDHSSFSCECNSFFYQGVNCDELSAGATALIASAGVLLLIVVLVFVVRRRAVTQKKQVLDELRDGLLRNTEGSNNEYIQYMQQALILNDVFVKFEEIKLEQKVGEGSFGVVHKATFRGASVAVKQMRSMFLELTEKEIDEFRKEAYVMSRLRHPNIVLVMGISLVDQEPIPLPKTRSVTQQAENDSMAASSTEVKKAKPQKTVCIITEYLEQGSLADILYGPTRLPAEVWTYELVLTCALQAARGMLYLHSHSPPICHRDLKSSNLVVDDHWVVKVTDFGMSRIVPQQILDEEKGITSGAHAEDREYIGRDSVGSITEEHNRASHLMINQGQSSRQSLDSLMNQNGPRVSTFSPEMTSNLGTTAWCAPELLTTASKTHYSVKVDVYSFGMVLWELWEKKRPFDEYNSRFDIMDAIRAGKRPEISSNCPPSYRSLLQRCWQTNPTRRPNFTYIVRYLKDELALVKRKRGATGGGMAAGMIGYRGDIFMSTSAPSYTPEQLGREIVEDRGSTSYQEYTDSDVRPSFLRRSFQAASQMVSSSPTQSSAFGWNSKNNSGNAVTTTVNSGGSDGSRVVNNQPPEAMTNSNKKAIMLNTLESTDGGGKERRSSTGNATRKSESPASQPQPVPLPENRSPLVAAAAFDRSLSYLTESPNPMGPSPAAMYGAKPTNNSGNNNRPLNINTASANSNNGPSGGGGGYGGNNNPRPPTTPQARPPSGGAGGGTPLGAQNQWRDKYVLKHSGWNKDRPDVGLPPSVSVSASPMTSSIGQPNRNSGRTHRGSMESVSTSVSASVGVASSVADSIASEDSGDNTNFGGGLAILNPMQGQSNLTRQLNIDTSTPAATPHNAHAGPTTPTNDQSGIFDIDPDEEEEVTIAVPISAQNTGSSTVIEKPSQDQA